MVERHQVYLPCWKPKQPCTRLRCQSLSSLPHVSFTEIRQWAKDGCTLEDPSLKVLQCAPNLNPLLIMSAKVRKRCQKTNIGTPTWFVFPRWGQGETTHLTSTPSISLSLTQSLMKKLLMKLTWMSTTKSSTPKSLYRNRCIEIASHLLVVGLRFHLSSYNIEGRSWMHRIMHAGTGHTGQTEERSLPPAEVTRL